jgi:hypothetical protein
MPAAARVSYRGAGRNTCGGRSVALPAVRQAPAYRDFDGQENIYPVDAPVFRTFGGEAR